MTSNSIEPGGGWRVRAACRTGAVHELFFPDGHTGRYDHQIEQAKTICRRCPVTTECATTAIQRGEEHGIWGAIDVSDLRRIRRQHGAKLRNPAYLAAVVQAELDEALRRQTASALVAVYERRTTAQDDGHTLWNGAPTAVTIRGVVYTPMRLAFFITHGRKAEGTVRSKCGQAGCVTGHHLADEKMRRAVPKPMRRPLQAAA
jgi:WhiB family redox-sensing transcriptional regulator